MEPTLLISVFLGIGLAAATGFRVFLPMFVLSLAAYTDWWELNEQWAWLGSEMALVLLGAAMISEILAYYIPWVDNALDTLAVPLAGLAGTAIMVATLSGMPPLMTWALAIIAGGGMAVTIKGANAGSRLGSSVATAGLGNPVVATLESIGAVILSVLSFLVPVVAAVFGVLILVGVIWVYRKLYPRPRKIKG